MCMLTSALQTSHTQGYHQSHNISMSNRPPATASSSNFKVIFERALKTYKKSTGQDRTVNPLFSQLQECDSPEAIRTILQNQVDQFIQPRSGDERLRNWLNPTINVLYAFSATLAGGAGVVNDILYVGDIPLIHSIGFPCRQCDFCWCWCSPLSKCPGLLTCDVPCNGP